MQETIERLLARSFHINPAVAMLELKRMLRGPRLYVGICAFALIMALALTSQLDASHSRPGGSFTLVASAGMLLGLLTLILPGMAGSALAGEREKGTLELLFTTQLRPADILGGKLIANAAYMYLLLLAALPVAVWAMVPAGADLLRVLLAYCYLGVVVVELTLLVLLVSTMADTTGSAVLCSYLLVYMGGSVVSGLVVGLAGLRSATLGREGATYLTVLVALLGGGLAYVGARVWLERQRRHGRPARTGSAVAVAVAAEVVLVGGLLALLPLLAQSPERLVLAALPHVGLSMILSGQQAGLPAAAGGTIARWAVSTSLAVVVSLVLWMAAVRCFELRDKQS